jgi:hypothetical protein
MKTEQWSCDRCQRPLDSQFSVDRITIEMQGGNPTKRDLCRACCSRILEVLLSPPVQP